MTIFTSSSLDDVIDHVNDVTIASRIFADRKIKDQIYLVPRTFSIRHEFSC